MIVTLRPSTGHVTRRASRQGPETEPAPTLSDQQRDTDRTTGVTRWQGEAKVMRSYLRDAPKCLRDEEVTGYPPAREIKLPQRDSGGWWTSGSESSEWP